MAKRTDIIQSDHDEAVYAAENIYEQHEKNIWINPGSEKNKSWNAQYIDVIVTEKRDSEEAWVIEIETEDSVSSTEAKNQWKKYSKAFSQRWYLAVPSGFDSKALKLLEKENITNCKVITWKKNKDETYTFWGLPGTN